MQKVAKVTTKNVQKVAKILTIFGIYDNNIISGGIINDKIIRKEIIRLEKFRNEKAINGNTV